MFKAAELVQDKTSLKIGFPDSQNFIPALPTFVWKHMSLVAFSFGSESEETENWTGKCPAGIRGLVIDTQKSWWDMEARLILLPSYKVEWEK